MKERQITNNRTLLSVGKEMGWIFNEKFKYMEKTVEHNADYTLREFECNRVTYQLKFHPGCFNPFLYQIY